MKRDEVWRMEAWDEAQRSLERMNQSIVRTAIEIDRRERWWTAAGTVLGGLLGMWIYRDRSR